MKKIRNNILSGITLILLTAMLILSFFAPEELWAPWFMLGLGAAGGFYVGTFVQALASYEAQSELKNQLEETQEKLNSAYKTNNKLRKRLNKQNKDDSNARAKSWTQELDRLANDPDLVDTSSAPSATANAVISQDADTNEAAE